MAIALTVGLVSGAAYAVFSDTVEVNGIAITAGNADLRIGMNGGEWNGVTDYLMDLEDIYPGYMTGDKFRLINESSSAIGLDVEGRLTAKSGNWDILKNKVEVAVVEYSSEGWANNAADTNTVNNGHITESTGWKTLNWWFNNDGEITGSPIAQGAERHFVLWYRVDGDAGNEIAEKNVNLNITLTGTQAL